MFAPYGSDEYWKKHLTPERYAVMRGGMVEPPGTGAYLTNTKHGSYHCAACTARLFATSDVLPGGTSYVTCAAPVSPETVLTEERYTHAGGQFTAVLCATCGSVVGKLADVELLGAQHLETGERQRFFELYSTALVFRRSLTARNFPFLYLFGVFLLVASVGVGYFLFVEVQDATTFQNLPPHVRLWLVDGEIEVRTIAAGTGRVDITEETFASSSAALVAFPDSTSRSLSIRGLPSSSVLVWLDRDFTVVSVEKLDKPLRTLEENPSVVLALILVEPLARRAAGLTRGNEVILLERSKGIF